METIAKAKKVEIARQARAELGHPDLIIEVEDGRFVPSSEGRDLVSKMTLAGADTNAIGKVFGLSGAWVRKWCKYEIESALTVANGVVAGALYDSAVGGDVKAQKFWLKAKAGWREKDDPSEISGQILAPIINVTVSRALESINVSKCIEVTPRVETEEDVCGDSE